MLSLIGIPCSLRSLQRRKMKENHKTRKTSRKRRGKAGKARINRHQPLRYQSQKTDRIRIAAPQTPKLSKTVRKANHKIARYLNLQRRRSAQSNNRQSNSRQPHSPNPNPFRNRNKDNLNRSTKLRQSYPKTPTRPTSPTPAPSCLSLRPSCRRRRNQNKRRKLMERRIWSENPDIKRKKSIQRRLRI